MNAKGLATIFIVGLAVLMLAACGGQPPIDIDTIMAQQKTYVGSDTCKMCHLEHYDSWNMTLHSRMTQDATKNQVVIIAPIDETHIREEGAPVHFFRMLKELTLLGYFTSEIGYTQAMRYTETPGRFDPCVPYSPGDKSWADHA